MDMPLVEQVRSFNRSMTERVGVLNDHFLGRNHPLGEARLLWEIGEEGARIRELRRRLGLDSAYVMLLRIELFAGVGQYCVFATLLLLLYIDQRKSALLLVLFDALCISVVTLLSLSLNDLFFGLGYLAVAILCALFGWFLLNARLKRLEFLTFMTQSIK